MKSLLSSEITKLLADQAARENGVSAQYKAFALSARNMGFFGSEKFLVAAALEETTHRDRFLDYLNDMAGGLTKVEGALDRKGAGSLKEIFELVLGLEIDTSMRIHAIYAAAHKAGDFYTVEFMKFFLEEQLTSVRECQDIVNRLASAGTNLLEFDEWIGEK